MENGRKQDVSAERASLVTARGPRAVERALLDQLARHGDEARADPLRLARPVRVVVPSRSLRLHLAATVARELGAVAGVELQTLHGVALEILENAGVDLPGGDEWIELLARRHARETPVLAAALGPFEDGFRGVVAAVRDLLDSGLEPALADAARECLASRRAGAGEEARCRALIDVGLRVAADLERSGGGRSGLLRRAREVFERDPERALPTRALHVHGFADATGRAAELLEVLARRFSGSVLLDRPDDPLAAGSADAGVRFTERLAQRLEAALGPRREAGAAPPPGSRRLLRAPAPEAEAREVARALRALLDAGAAPERIGVVARDLGPYRAALRTHLARLGVPFSALRARAPLDGPGRRLAALADILRTSGDTSTERWLDALGSLARERPERPRQRPPSGDLRLALRVLGAARLAQAAAFEVELEGDRFPLPVRNRVAPGGELSGGERRGFSAWRRKLEGSELRAARAAARSLLARFERWPRRASGAEHLARFSRLRRRDLGWRARDPAEIRARAALLSLARTLGAEALEREEFAALAARALLAAAAPPLGGTGAGVQVLDAMEARARTFEHLFLIGMSRDVFPRVVREDPLLPDGARRALESVLPDVPIKARGRDEERFLFAQFLAASPDLTLSWSQCDDDGKRQVVSPLIERLLGRQREEDVESVPPLHPERDDAPRPGLAAEHAVLAGLRGEKRSRPRLFELALGEAQVADAPAIARARARVLAAHEAGPFEPARLGPWLGFLGRQERVGVRPDPRSEPPAVTRVEALAKCPWQAVLTRFLRLDEGFECLDGPTRIDPRSVGNVVHGVLEKMAREVLGEEERPLEAVLRRAALPVPWPEPARFEELLAGAAREALRSAHAPPGLVRWLAECARPALERAREILAREGAHGGGVLGVEIGGRAAVPGDGGAELVVTFRADRVERLGEELVLTDFKTGKPLTRKELLEKGVPRGRNLQPIAYVLGAGDADREVRGRYLFLGADGSDEKSVGLGAQHGGAARDLGAVLGAVWSAWLAGTFFPRLFDEEQDREPEACRTCTVSQACLRGDSGARLALNRWTSAPMGSSGGGSGESCGQSGGAEAALRDLWRLAGATREEPR